MKTKKNFSFLLLLLCSINIAFSQIKVKEDGFDVIHFDKKIEIQFDHIKNEALNLKAFDAISNREINIQKSDNSYILDNLSPAEMIRLEYRNPEDKSGAIVTSYVATQSLSTGEIKVYFNHQVDTSFSQTQNAVNLGNTLDDKLISLIDACVSTLDIAIYNSASPSSTTGIAGAINAAYARGVQVRLIYDGSTTSAMIPLINPAIPVLASPDSSSYGIMHNKFVIFDANSSDANIPLVWTGSTNWTVVQIDGPDKNSAISIQDQSLALAYKLEFDEMWGSANATPDLVTSKFGPYKTDNTPHNFIIGGKAIQCYFSPSDGANSKIIAAINTANSDIDIATMLVTRTDIKNALLNKFNSGMTNINLVVDTQNPSGNQFSTIQSGLLPGHAQVCPLSGIMHHKFVVIDNFDSTSDPQVLLGSHNWSTSAETKNDENILIIHDANIANQYYQAFAYLYQQAGGVFLSNENFDAQDEIVVSPNPSTGIFHIENRAQNSTQDVDVAIYDITGRKIFSNNYENMLNGNIDLSNQSNGMYFVQLTTANKLTNLKIIKR